MKQKTLEYIQFLIHNDMQQTGAMINNAQNHDPQTREYWRQRQEIALDAMRELASVAKG